MDREQNGTYGVADLAALGDVSRRTVRYYVQMGLLPAPSGPGRGAFYTDAHLARLIEIRQLQEAGVSLAEIGSRLDKPGRAARPLPVRPPDTPPNAGSWARYTLGDGIELHIRADRSITIAQLLQFVALLRGQEGSIT